MGMLYRKQELSWDIPVWLDLRFSRSMIDKWFASWNIFDQESIIALNFYMPPQYVVLCREYVFAILNKGEGHIVANSYGWYLHLRFLINFFYFQTLHDWCWTKSFAKFHFNDPYRETHPGAIFDRHCK